MTSDAPNADLDREDRLDYARDLDDLLRIEGAWMSDYTYEMLMRELFEVLE